MVKSISENSKLYKKLSILTLILIFSQEQALSQSFLNWQYNDRYFSLGLHTGWTAYFGELNHNNSFEDGLNNLSVNVEARLFSKWSARASITRYSIHGGDQTAKDSTRERQRNLSFRSKNMEFSLIGQYYLLPYKGKYYSRRKYEPYVFLGIGATTYNPKTDFQDQEIELRDLQTEGVKYGSVTMAFPMGIGVKARLNQNIDLVLEAGYRYTLTDYLDDVSRNYVFKSDRLESRIADRSWELPLMIETPEDQNPFPPGSSRGSRKSLDSYLFVNVGISIYLPGDILKKPIGNRKKEKIIGKPSAY